MVRPQHRICFPAVSLFLILLTVFSGTFLLAQDSQEGSATRPSPQQVSPPAEAPVKPAPEALTQAESCSVEGTVVTAAGSVPLRGARVLLSSAEGERPSEQNYSASTDAEGRFQISGVAPGRYAFR